MNEKKRRRLTACLLVLSVIICLAGCKKEEKSKKDRPDMDALRAAEVGSYIYFGEYEQDNDASTGKEAIEWLVLDKQGDRMLVISRHGLDCQPYDIEYLGVTWETCSLRRGWLNGVFYETAFIPEEKNMILTSVVTADANPEHDTPAGNDTTDKVFLLSIDEVNLYFADDAARTCIGTPYCYAQGAREDDNGNCWWWLRSPGNLSDKAACVLPDGVIDDLGDIFISPLRAVRPAMWIDISSIPD